LYIRTTWSASYAATFFADIISESLFTTTYCTANNGRKLYDRTTWSASYAATFFADIISESLFATAKYAANNGWYVAGSYTVKYAIVTTATDEYIADIITASQP
jgi:hypothetical protein